MLYILDNNGEPIPTNDAVAWGRWFQGHDRRVELTELANGARVSTVFLGIDHNWSAQPDPVLWETMVFGAPDGYDRQERYTSRNDAINGHWRIVGEVQGL